MTTDQTTNQEQAPNPKRKGFLYYSLVAPAKFVFVKMPLSVFGAKSIQGNNEYIKSLIQSIRSGEPKDSSRTKQQPTSATPKAIKNKATYLKLLFWLSIVVFGFFLINLFYLTTNMRFEFSKGNWIVNIAFGLFLLSLFTALRYNAYITKTEGYKKTLMKWLFDAITFRN